MTGLSFIGIKLYLFVIGIFKRAWIMYKYTVVVSFVLSYTDNVYRYTSDTFFDICEVFSEICSLHFREGELITLNSIV